MDATQWPLPFQIRPKRFFLGPERTLVQTKPKWCRASAEGGDAAGAVGSVEGGGLVYSIRHDPMNPVPTIGGNITSGEPLMIAGAYDQV